jgi:hypothetical protein
MKIVIINDLVLYHLFLPTTVVLSITIFQYHNDVLMYIDEGTNKLFKIKINTRRVFLENLHLDGFVKV